MDLWNINILIDWNKYDQGNQPDFLEDYLGSVSVTNVATLCTYTSVGSSTSRKVYFFVGRKYLFGV